MELIEIEGKLPIIKTNRLILRNIEITDISDDYINWLNNPSVNKFLEIRFSTQTRETVEEFIQSKLTNIENSKHFGIYDSDGQRLVGTVTVPIINHHHKFANLSFVIGHPEASGKGYATEAVHGILYYMFYYCGIEKMEAGYYEGHTGSEKVLAKNNFTIEGRRVKELINSSGERVDHILVGLLKKDFKPDEALLGHIEPQMNTDEHR